MGCRSIGRSTVFGTVGCRFESYRPSHSHLTFRLGGDCAGLRRFSCWLRFVLVSFELDLEIFPNLLFKRCMNGVHSIGAGRACALYPEEPDQTGRFEPRKWHRSNCGRSPVGYQMYKEILPPCDQSQSRQDPETRVANFKNGPRATSVLVDVAAAHHPRNGL